MRRIRFNEAEIKAIEDSFELRKKSIRDPEYHKELDALISTLKSSEPILDDEQKRTIRYSVNRLLVDEHEHLLFHTEKQYEQLLRDPKLTKIFEQFNFAFGIFNKVRMRSDPKWTPFDLPTD